MRARALDDDRQAVRLLRTIETPEGVPLQVRLASFGERASALLIDLSILFGGLLVFWLVLLLMPSLLSDRLALAALVLVSFVVRSFYFAWFELRWRGATPGKRSMRLRVIDRRGGPLGADAVMARNLMREVELFLPLSLLLVLDLGGDEGLVTLLALGWVGALALLPLVNRDRLRAGDMVGGTWVIVAPRHMLLPDLAGRAPVTPRPAAPGQLEAPEYRFSERQLAVYGVYELQVLEDALRRRGPGSEEIWRSIADRIQRKIAWQPPEGRPADARRFLDAFYRAQRARLETDLTFDRHRKDKHDRRG